MNVLKSNLQKENGITLVTLIITIVILVILTFTITVNVDQYANQKVKANFESDIQSLKEEINQYYARKKELPIINKYTNISMLEGDRNVNDNDKYYIIDRKELDVNLNYGADYSMIINKGVTEEITDILDIYIINEQSHTIYYPKGIEYNGKIHYRLPEVYSEIIF